MLIQFSVKNFKSFKDEVILSMVSSSIKELKEDNVFKPDDKLSLLKSAVIYGANASGKSNLLLAMQFMKYFIENSSKESQVNEKIDYNPFKLSTETDNTPNVFEIIFIYNKVRYRYGFSINSEKVCAEWLFYTSKKQELKVFTRENQEFELTNHFKKEKILIEKNMIRPNALLLSVSAQFNSQIAEDILEWFFQFNIISTSQTTGLLGSSCQKIENEKTKKIFLDFLKKADFGINEISIERIKEKFIRVNTSHKKYDKNGKEIDKVIFDMVKDESEGTKKFFELLGPIIDTISYGKILIIDELDSKLHPNIINEICRLFNSKEKNPKNSQLIFISHNTNVLDKDIFRRDQIWFIEKDKFEASQLYSLAEYKEENKKIRNDASYEKDYLRGRYGAVPCLSEFEVNNDMEK